MSRQLPLNKFELFIKRKTRYFFKQTKVGKLISNIFTYGICLPIHLIIKSVIFCWNLFFASCGIAFCFIIGLIGLAFFIFFVIPIMILIIQTAMILGLVILNFIGII